MIIALTLLHVLVSIFMIAVVLLQSGKGAEMGASFGSGGSQSVFGAGGGTTFLSKMTTGAAVIFMLTSLTLAYISGQPSSSSIMSGKGKSAATTKMPVQMPQPMTPAQQSKPADMPGAPAAPPQQQK
ncbi:preprotein translocase subunit SecG [Oryzomonas rubra]|uniref:Protein-export membrane protein SecG n=1 Tax=Oryzomonas rubra TaxID=2509454 RepID=A0A5A9X4U3_9BACT|nr:preprotein translocase subunit SecG [Oryzomonas rubra]KAA0888010.1 preprotein translocase subunit SecG [Oryzomonas rubra]